MPISDIYDYLDQSTHYNIPYSYPFLVAQDNLFPVHITSLQYTCAVFGSSVLTDGCLRTLSLYSPGAAPRVFELAHVRRALHLCTEDKFGPQCAGPRTLHLNIALHPTIREQQVYISNVTFKDKDNPIRVKHQYIYIYTSIATHVRHKICQTCVQGLHDDHIIS